MAPGWEPPTIQKALEHTDNGIDFTQHPIFNPVPLDVIEQKWPPFSFLKGRRKLGVHTPSYENISRKRQKELEKSYYYHGKVPEVN